MEITDFVIHRINKEAGTNPTVHFAPKRAKLNKRASSFTEKALKAFKGKHNRIYAAFNPDTEEYPLSVKCWEYFDGGDFLSFTKTATNRLSNQMKGTTATGGYLIFSGFNDEDGRHLLILMLAKDQEGVTVDDKTHELKESPHLDLSSIDKAATIDAGTAGAVRPDQPLAYAGFQKALSEYFQKFLGPDRNRNPKKESKLLKTALDAFMVEKAFAPARCEQVKLWLHSKAKECDEGNVDLDLATISAYVYPESPQAFQELANNEKYGLSAFLRPDPKSFEIWTIVDFQSERFRIRFKEAEVLNHSVELFDEGDSKSLKIKNVPQELVEKVQRILGEDA